MSTRCCIEIYDGDYDLEDAEKLGKPVILYHHSDGYPKFQLPKLVAFLGESYSRLSQLGYSYWWDSDRVSAMLVLLSANQYDAPNFLGEADFKKATRRNTNGLPIQELTKLPYGYPQYQPTGALHGDIEFLYRVSLLRKAGIDLSPEANYKITCYCGTDKVGKFEGNAKKLRTAAVAKAAKAMQETAWPKE
jgi:hypothetical protein